MKYSINFLIGIVILLSITSCNNSTQITTNGVIKGKVYLKSLHTNINGNIIDTVLYSKEMDSVKILLTQNNIVLRTIYSKAGDFSFDNLGSGAYSVRPKINDYISSDSKQITLMANDTAKIDSLVISAYSNFPDSLKKIVSYPNPFTSNAMVQFDIQRKNQVFLDLFNLTGEKIQTLINGDTLEPGTHVFLINGDSLVGGIYFILLRTSNFYSYTDLVKQIK